MIGHHRKHSKIVLFNHLIVSSTKMKIRCSRPTNCSSVFQPLYLLSRVWGLAPFSIVTNSNGEVRSPKIGLHDGLQFSTMMVFYSFFVYNNLNTFEPSEENRNEKTWVLMLSGRLLELLGFLYGISAIIMNVRNRSKIINKVKLLTRFDREVFLHQLHNINILITFLFLQRWKNWKSSSTMSSHAVVQSYCASQQPYAFYLFRS